MRGRSVNRDYEGYPGPCDQDSMACSPETVRRAQRFAQAASVLAQEPSLLTLLNVGACHDSDVALRSARQAQEAAAELERLATEGATLDETLEAAAWAMSAAAVALTQAKLTPTARRIPVADPEKSARQA